MRVFLIVLSCTVLVLPSFGQNRVGINTIVPIAELDVRPVAPEEGGNLHLGSGDDQYFLRLFSGKVASPFPALWWKPGQSLRFATANADASGFQEHMRLDGEGRLGLGTDNPLFRFDLHSTGPESAPNLQLTTPDGGHFLRLFAGHNADPKPFLLFNNTDTFRIAHSGPNYESFTEHITLLPSGSMGILKNVPQAKLDMMGGDWDLDNGNPGDLRIGSDDFNFRIGVATGGGGAGTVRLYSQGGDLLLGTNNVQRVVIDTSGRVGIGQGLRKGKLHIRAESTLPFPQLRLTEIGDDYARIKFENTAFPDSYWDIAARGGTDSSGLKRFNLFFHNGVEGRDLFLLLGSGHLYRNSFGASTYDYFFTNNDYRGGIGFQMETLRLFTAPASDGKIEIGTREAAHLVIDTLGHVGIGLADPEDKLHVDGIIRASGLAGSGTRNVVADADGRLAIGNAAFLSDMDGDTRINVEAAPDEDKIRFHLGGTERWVMDSARLEPRNTGRSVFIGEGAGASDDLTANANIAIGSGALYHNGTGSGQIAIGDSTLFSLQPDDDDGIENTAVGHRVLKATTLGSYNTGVGHRALSQNTTGFGNTALGTRALASNTLGSSNTAIGFQALVGNETGTANTAVGDDALFLNQSGSSNCVLGAGALYFNLTGSGNIAAGTSSLINNSTGNRNIAIGDKSLHTSVDRSYLVAIGDSSLYKNGLGATLPEHGTANTGIGSKTLAANTLGRDNTATGYRSLFANSTGAYNTGLGSNALVSNTTGSYNTAIGTYALKSNTTAIAGTAVGYGALHENTAGQNTGVGFFALYSNTSGAQNTALGSSALLSNIGGGDNVAIGFEALADNESGTDNVGVGSGALVSNNASGNVAIGFHALYANVVGFQNTAVGNMASATGDYFNTTAIGSGTNVTANNQVRIGNASVTSIGGYANWTNVSDGRFKRQLLEDVPGLGFILRLRPVTYTLDVHGLEDHLSSETGMAGRPDWPEKYDRETVRQTGFIAQEVEQAAQAEGFDFSGVDAPEDSAGLYGLRYAEFVVPLVKAVQELAEENERLKTQLQKQSTAFDQQLAIQQSTLEALLQAQAALQQRIEALTTGYSQMTD